MGLFAASVALLGVLLAYKARADETCALETFKYPELFGADFDRITANRALNVTGAFGTPEGRLVPASGLNVCNVTITYHHTGKNDTTTVQVWLPLEGWNGRFVGVGGGGFVAGRFNGEPLAATVNLGYAAAITDAGHDTANWASAAWGLKSPGNLNYDLFYNFAYVSVHDMTIIGKSITSQYYAKQPAYSYFFGCSTGGRQAITSAQRYPDDYDGILAGAPAINNPDLTISTYWPQFVMDRLGVYPSKCELDALARFEVEACDALDGLKDGVIDHPDTCRFDPQSAVGRPVQCGADNYFKNITISAAAATIMQEVRRGPRGPDGKPFFVGVQPGTPFTGTLAGGNTFCAQNGACVGVPFPMSLDWIKLLTRRDPTYNVTAMSLQDLALNYRLSRQTLNGIIAGNDPDLSLFKAGKKKMISWHGMADECITVLGTRHYYDRVLARDPSAGDYFRYFEAPGTVHCNGLQGTYYPLRAMAALVEWVEEGKAPDVLLGYRLESNTGVIEKDPSVRRPICQYPDEIKYDGGDVTSWESWRCEKKEAKPPDECAARDEL